MFQKVWYLIFMLLGAAQAVAEDAPLMQQSPPPRNLEDFTLPGGRLEAVYITKNSVSLINLDRTVKQGSVVWSEVFIVVDPGFKLGERIATQVILKEEFDCKVRTVHTLAAKSFDNRNNLLMWYLGDPPHKTVKNSADDFISQILCGQAKLSKKFIYVGHAAAVKAAQAAIRAAPKSAK